MKPKDWDKVSQDYFEEIMSPFSEGVEVPFEKYLPLIKSHDSVIDLGCGIGNLIPHIDGKFKKITCLDFSKGMIQISKKKYGDKKHIDFVVGDIKNLSEYHDKYDAVFAINSVIEPSVESIKKSLSEIHRTLNKNGVFIGIFPAVESEIFKATMVYDLAFKKTKSERKAIKKAHSMTYSKNYEFLMGFFDCNGRQKHFYKVQLEYRLRNAGFKNIRFDKVLYPWKSCDEKILRDCKDEMRIFDWFVFAEK